MIFVSAKWDMTNTQVEILISTFTIIYQILYF